MTLLVLNEWLWADLRGENGQAKRSETFETIVRLSNSSHRIVIAEGSAFDKKAWRLCKEHPLLGGAFVKVIRLNSERCMVVPLSTLPVVPERLRHDVKQDDWYLVRVLDGFPDAVLVSTDGVLTKALKEAGYQVMDRAALVNSLKP